MMQPTEYISAVIKWYRREARFLIGSILSKRFDIIQFDKDCEVLEDKLKRIPEPMPPICVIGQISVGKSTLINALVADGGIVVPSGGMGGALTASALQVRYGKEKRLTVTYHGKDIINETRNALEFSQKNNADNQTLVENSAHKRAKVFVKGDQNADCVNEYLIDALRFIQKTPDNKLAPLFDSEILDEDKPRLESVRETAKIGSSKEKTKIYTAENERAFDKVLSDHVSNHLAPLIDRMTLDYPADVLSGGVELTDLPGLGGFKDEHQKVTREYLNDASAVMLVVERGGETVECASLLKDSGFLTSLLYGKNVAFLVAIVKVDSIAEEHWRKDRDMNGGKAKKSKTEHFKDVCSRVKQTLQQQIKEQLTEVWQEKIEENGTEEKLNAEAKEVIERLRKNKTEIIESLSRNVSVHPVSAIQYRMILANDEDDSPFLRDKEDTNIPALRETLKDLAVQHRRKKEERLMEDARNFFMQLKTKFAVQKMELEATVGDNDKSEPERLRYDDLIEKFLQPLRKEYGDRQKRFRDFLTQTMPEKIASDVQGRVNEAAAPLIRRYLDGLVDDHWTILKASVVRGGSYKSPTTGRHIDLPNDLSQHFEAPVAVVWTQFLLDALRLKTRDHISFVKHQVEQFLDWASKSQLHLSLPSLEEYLKNIEAQMQKITTVGEDVIEQLKDSVKNQLYKVIYEPIRKDCLEFVDKGGPQGPGTKKRILELFRDLAADVRKTGQEIAKKTLTDCYIKTEGEILAAFERIQDPLDEAKRLLMSRFAKQGATDFTEELKLLGKIDEILNLTPMMLEGGGSINELSSNSP